MGEDEAIDILLLVLILALGLPILGMCIKDMNATTFDKYSFQYDKSMRRVSVSQFKEITTKTSVNDGVTTQETRDLRGSDLLLMIAAADNSMPEPKTFVLTDVPNTGNGENTIVIDNAYVATKDTNLQKAVKELNAGQLNTSIVVRRSIGTIPYWEVRRATP